MIPSNFLTTRATETLRAWYAAHGTGPTEPLAIERTALYLVTIEKLRQLKGIANTVSAINADDGTTYAIVGLPRDFRPAAT